LPELPSQGISDIAWALVAADVPGKKETRYYLKIHVFLYHKQVGDAASYSGNRQLPEAERTSNAQHHYVGHEAECAAQHVEAAGNPNRWLHLSAYMLGFPSRLVPMGRVAEQVPGLQLPFPAFNWKTPMLLPVR
jgi:hypothetical protein